MIKSKPSQAQLNANRENAKKSTGPTSETGKEKSKFNATRHNLTGKVRIQTSEDMDAYYKFTRELVTELAPEGSLEKSLAQSIADAQWRLSRAPAHEENILTYELSARGKRFDMEPPQAHAAFVQSIAFFERSKDFANIALYEQRLNSQLHKNLKALMEMKKNRALRRSPDEVAAELTAMPDGYIEDDDSSESQTLTATAESTPVTPLPDRPTAPVKPVPASPLGVPASDRLTTPPESTTYPENGFDFSNAPQLPKPGRNAKCPCGSGMKFKRCCLNKSQMAA